MTTTTLLAYHGKQEEKDAILAQLQAHRAADQLVKGIYWDGGKGCAVGCAIHGNDHAQYEPLFGIPSALAHLEDTIFDGLPNAKAMEWPMRFMGAIQPGADLSRVQWRFLHWLLTDVTVNPGIHHPLVAEAVRGVADLMALLADGQEVSPGVARSAASAAWSAAWSVVSADGGARSTVWSAAWSAASAASAAGAASAASAARSAADSTVWSAAWSAADSAAWRAASAASAASAARSAAWSAAWSVVSAESVARRAYGLMAIELILLLEAV